VVKKRKEGGGGGGDREGWTEQRSVSIRTDSSTAADRQRTVDKTIQYDRASVLRIHMHRHSRAYSHTHRKSWCAGRHSSFYFGHLQTVALSFSLSLFPSVCRSFLQPVALSFSLSQFPSTCRTFLQSVAVSFSLSHFPSACRTFLQPAPRTNDRHVPRSSHLYIMQDWIFSQQCL